MAKLTVPTVTAGAFNWAQILAFIIALLQSLFPTPPQEPKQGSGKGCCDDCQCCAEYALYSHLVAMKHSAMIMAGLPPMPAQGPIPAPTPPPVKP